MSAADFSDKDHRPSGYSSASPPVRHARPTPAAGPPSPRKDVAADREAVTLYRRYPGRDYSKKGRLTTYRPAFTLRGG